MGELQFWQKKKGGGGLLDGTLEEDGHLVLLDRVHDVPGFALGVHDGVLNDHLGDELPLGDDEQLGGAVVDVRGVETAGLYEPNSHSDALIREGLMVCQSVHC